MSLSVLFLTPSTTMYGARRVLFNLANGLDRERFSPHVACSQRGELWAALGEAGVGRSVVPLRSWRKGKYLPLIPYNLVRLLQLIRRHGVQLIHCNEHWIEPYAHLVSRMAGVPHLCHVHNPVDHRRARLYHLDRAPWLLAISPDVAAGLRDMPGRRGELRTILNGIDVDHYSRGTATAEFRAAWERGDGSLLVGVPAKLTRRKGQDRLLKALAILRRQGRRVRCILIGEGDAHDRAFVAELHALVEQEELSDAVVFAGFCQDMPSVYGALDIVVLPSREEGFGLVVAEAMAAGKPVVATRSEGVGEMLADGRTGFLVDHDPEALAAALVRLVDFPELRDTLGQAGRELIRERFSVERQVGETELLYETIIGQWKKITT
jgi:glycosyltransferase involved in cell wall biosynthesis